MKAAKDKPSGFICECGTFHELGAYVFAHWYDSLVHTCNDCNAQHEVCNGRVTLIRRGKRMRQQISLPSF